MHGLAGIPVSARASGDSSCESGLSSLKSVYSTLDGGEWEDFPSHTL